MNLSDLSNQLVARVAMNQPDAVNFLQRWVHTINAIDDLVDTKTSAEFKIALFVRALELFNHPFYLAHRATLNPVILNIANLYADSVAWSGSEVDWQNAFADYARHGGSEMFLTVAGIVGGYTHQRAVSLELRAGHYAREHDEVQSGPDIFNRQPAGES